MKSKSLLTSGTMLSDAMMKRKTYAILIIAMGFMACNKISDDNEPHAVESNKYTASVSSGDFWICGTNNISNMLEVYDQITYPDINHPSALQWSWMPSTALGYSTSDVAAWIDYPEGDPMDAKLRNSTIWAGSTQVVVSVGGDLATVCRYTGGTPGQKLWARNVGAGAYPHAAELLPNGNVAVAASHGDWVRVYDTSVGQTDYFGYSLAGAHGVLWDPAYNCLWAIGDTKLIKFSVGGTKTSPTLTVVSTTTIPGNGHDLSAFLGNNNKLWFTSSGAVYIYDKPSGTYVTAPGASNRAAIKSVSNQPSGLIIETKPHQDCSSFNDWCTPHVQAYNGTTGSLVATYTKTGAGFYKADVWTDLYQTPSQTATLTPIEDAYMRDGIYGENNYGTETVHYIKHGDTSYSRKAFFKFDVSSIPSTVTKVKLRVYGSNIESTSNVTIKSYRSSTDNWTETGITWNNAPVAYSIGSTTVNNTLKYYEWDVTSYVRDQVNGDNIASLVLHQIAGGNLTTTWHSREGVNKPQLVITY